MFFSIVVPVYNAGATVRRAIDSILSQTCGDFELILADDGSDDNSADICGGYAENDKRVRLLRLSHKGPAATRNAGIKAAVGRYIMFLDADDAFRNDTLEKLHVALTREEYDIVWFGFSLHRAGKNAQISLPPAIKYGDPDEIRAAYLDIITSACFKPVGSKAYRRDLLSENGLLLDTDISVGEDKCFNIDAIEHSKNMLFMDEPFYIIYKTPGSLTEKCDLAKFGQTVKTHEYIARHLLAADGSNRALAEIRYDYARLCLSHFIDFFRAGTRHKRDLIKRDMGRVDYDYPKRYLKYLPRQKRVIYRVFRSGVSLIWLFSYLNYLRKYKFS